MWNVAQTFSIAWPFQDNSYLALLVLIKQEFYTDNVLDYTHTLTVHMYVCIYNYMMGLLKSYGETGIHQHPWRSCRLWVESVVNCGELVKYGEVIWLG